MITNNSNDNRNKLKTKNRTLVQILKKNSNTSSLRENDFVSPALFRVGFVGGGELRAS